MREVFQYLMVGLGVVSGVFIGSYMVAAEQERNQALEAEVVRLREAERKCEGVVDVAEVEAKEDSVEVECEEEIETWKELAQNCVASKLRVKR